MRSFAQNLVCQSNVQRRIHALHSPAQNVHPTSAKNALISNAQSVLQRHVSALWSHALQVTTLAHQKTALGSTNVK